MKNLLIATGLLASIWLINSCGKATCLDPGIRVTLKGFDSTELDTIYLEQYIANKGFATRVTISVFDSAHLDDIIKSHDTIYRSVVDSNGFYIAPGYDYKVIVPADSATYTISGISYHQLKQSAPKNGKGGCTNDTYYYADTTPVKISGKTFTQTKVPPINIVLNK